MNWKRYVLGLGLLVGIGSALGFYWLLDRERGELRLHGIVETQEVRLSSKIGGRIKKILVREGETVQPNQELVLLEAPELEARRDQLQAAWEAAQAQLARAQNGSRPEEKAAARATLDLAEAKLKRLEAGYRREEVTMAHGDWKALEGDLQRAQKDWEREERLLSSRSTSAAEHDAAWGNLVRLREQSKVAHARWQMMTAGYRPEEIAEARAERDKARAQLELLENGTRAEEIAEAKARVAELYAKVRENDAQLQEAVVLAPDAALVEVVAVRRGDTVAPNQPLVRVLLAEDLWVKAYVPEPELGKVRLNQEVNVTIDSFPGRTFRGVIGQIASVSEFTPRNVQTADERHHQVFAIKVRVLESAQVFKSGMAAEVIIPLQLNPEK